jgi:hypothetical protein
MLVRDPTSKAWSNPTWLWCWTRSPKAWARGGRVLPDDRTCLDSWHIKRGLPEPWQAHLPQRGHPQVSRSTTGLWRRRPAPAVGAGARPTDSPGPSHSPRTTSVPACPETATRQRNWPHAIRDRCLRRRRRPVTHPGGTSRAENGHGTAKPVSRHTKLVPATAPTARMIPETTKLPAGCSPAGSFGKPKRVVQGTTHACARGDLNPHVLADTGT